MIINEQQMDKHLRQWWQDNKDLIDFNELKLFKTKEMFSQLMTEKNNLSKTMDEQLSMLTDIAYGFAINEKENATFNRYADNKHLNYFDIFLEDGQRGMITEALNRAGISTDVLKGIKKNVPYDATIDGVRVVQETEPPSNTISYFAIYKDGEKIYEWSRSSTDYGYYDEDFFEPDEFYQPDDTPSVEISYDILLSEKDTKSNYVKTYHFIEGRSIIERVSKSGKTFYQYSDGRFAPNPNKGL